MKLNDRQLLLPVVIGLSLTGVGATLLYFLYKKDDDPNDNRTTNLASSRQNVIEIKVPRQFVPALIGRGGATIREIQEQTETRLNFSTDDKDVSDRICKIRGRPECVRLAQTMIENIIANQPVIEVYETYVPQRACGRIIGRGGDTIQHIQATSGAKVIVESSPRYNNPDAKRRLIIKGTAEHIAAALAQIEEKVREENEIREQLDVSLSSRVPRGKISPRNTAVQTSDSQPESTDSLSSQVPEGSMEVYVSAVENPGQFWVQVIGPGAVALDKLVEEMTAYYSNEDNKELHALEKVEVGQKVAAKFEFDEKWYRAEVIGKLEENQYEVYFVDYGDHQKLNLEDMMELRTDFLSLRLQAIECSLANVKPREDEWSSEASDRFADLSWVAQWKPLTAKVRGYKERVLARGNSRREGSPIPCIDLYDKSDDRDINIGRELIAEVVAEEDGSWSAASSTLSLTRRNNSESPTKYTARPSETPPPPPSNNHLDEKDAVEEDGSPSSANSTLPLTRRNNSEPPATPTARPSETPPPPPSNIHLDEKDAVEQDGSPSSANSTLPLTRRNNSEPPATPTARPSETPPPPPSNIHLDEKDAVEQDGSPSSANSTLPLTRRNNSEPPATPTARPSETPPPPPSNPRLDEKDAADDDGSLSAASSALPLTRRNNSEPPATSTGRPSETPPLPPSNAQRSVKIAAPVRKRASLHPQRSGQKVVEIDLTTPKKQVEVIDLVTPSKARNASKNLISSERNGSSNFRKNGSGDGFRNDSESSTDSTTVGRQLNNPRGNIVPGGFETDLAEDSDGFDIE